MATNTKKISDFDTISYLDVDGSNILPLLEPSGSVFLNKKMTLTNFFYSLNNITTDFRFNNNTFVISSGNVSVSGSEYISKNLYVSGNTSIDNYVIANNATISKNISAESLNVSGSTISGTSNTNFLNVANTANFGGNVVVTGNTTVSKIIKSGGTSTQFLKADGSVDETSYMTANGFTTSIATNGYINYPGGLIMQWGYEPITNLTFSFPIKFPNACLIFATTNSNSQGGWVDNAFGYASNNSSFFIGTKRSDVAGTISGYPCSWIAIGH